MLGWVKSSRVSLFALWKRFSMLSLEFSWFRKSRSDRKGLKDVIFIVVYSMLLLFLFSLFYLMYLLTDWKKVDSPIILDLIVGTRKWTCFVKMKRRNYMIVKIY